MTHAKRLGVAIGILLFAGFGCSVSHEQLKQALNEHPDLVFDVLEKNPTRFAEVAGKASYEARRLAQVKAEEEAKQEMEDGFKNPKSAKIEPGRAIRGNKNAPLMLVEYSDFQCPFCGRGYKTVEELRHKYGNKLSFMFKNYPLPFHPMAMPAAKRFEAIAMQSPEKAYRYHDEVFKHQDKLSSQGEKYLDMAAAKAGANMAKMKVDMNSKTVKARIDSDIAEANGFGISGTPGFLVGGVLVKGAYPTSYFEQIIDRKLSGDNGRSVASPEAKK